MLPTFAAVAILLSACGGSGASEEPAASWSFESEVPETVGEVLAVVSPFQGEILKDGYVSPDEYESAVLEVVRCVEERGYTIGTQPEWRDGGKTIYYNVVSSTGMAGVTELRKNHIECFDTYLATVLMVWTLQNAPDERRLQEARSALAECLADQGVDPGDGNAAAFSALLQQADEAVIPTMFNCSQRVSEEFGIPGFVG